MEPDVCIENGCKIRVVVVGVGSMPLHRLRDYTEMVTQHARIELQATSSFYKEDQKSPFGLQPWENGCLRFQFVIGRANRSQWEDFQAHRKVHGCIGVLHCPDVADLDAAYEKFVEICNEYPAAQTRRCFAFSPTQEQVEQDDKKRQQMVLFPPVDKQMLKHHVGTLMHDFAASILMAFESRVLLAEPMGATLTTPMDSHVSLSSEEVSKAKRRRLERVQKTMGDYSLLAGSPADAISHYNTAMELSRHTGDSLWNAGEIEGSICALVVTPGVESDILLEDEVRYKYYEAIQLYRRCSAYIFEVEAQLKLARFLCRRERGNELSREVCELLSNAVEVGRNLTDVNDQVVLFVEVARIFGTLGYERKSAFFSRQVAHYYQSQETTKAANSALQLLLLAARSYGVEYVNKSSIKQKEPDQSDSCETSPEVVSGDWNALQINVLGDVLAAAVRAGDPLLAWSAGARLLRYHYPYITPFAQASLVAALVSASARLPPGTRCSVPSLPFIRLLSLPSCPSQPQTEIIRKVAGKKEWWIESTASTGPFIYTPMSATASKANNTASGNSSGSSKDTITWVVDEMVEVLVAVANPSTFQVTAESIALSVDGAAFEASPVSLTLPPNTSQILTLSGVPRETGSVTVRGCFVNFTGVVTEHLFEEVEEMVALAAKGSTLVDPFRGEHHRDKFTPAGSIPVAPPLPLLSAHIVGGDGDIVMHEGESREVEIALANAGSVAVLQASLSVSTKQKEHSIRINHEALEAALPLAPGARVLVPVEIRAGLETNPENNRGVHPLVLVHYAGPESDDSTPLGRQLALPLQLHVKKGLSLVQARLLSMEVPALVNSTEERSPPLRIDPYRGCWSLQFLELELWNPAEVPFEIQVSVGDEKEDGGYKSSSRIDCKCSSRVLIPFDKLGITGSSERDEIKPGEVSTSINQVKFRWQWGRNSVGELQVADAIRAAVQESMSQILASNPLTFNFRLASEQNNGQRSVEACELTPVEMIVTNNTKDEISMELSVTCLDVTSSSCLNSVMWSGSMSGIEASISASQGQHIHSFELCFLVPGEYSLVGVAQVNSVGKKQQHKSQCYSSPPFTIHVS
ncbi:trafficking protein particle complex II-specific subunit 120 homolog [Selaginella moellendorffii]|uniref:trafficking protein particle complex II-specific subunit 120 homolog n=1 Tax=Selaginella moellendorffii TaxID=88036 RepID=UPI000D1C4214|nr:trafficking protein particle complex II-specific subunit 120 homolog [Selaginella moellendorffii]|eukprot:XP_024540956.1 trafficking protein particle complex II-specific subunit 120 homolog [Selaginella moellendorffii]